jgi:penicillin-binding protein 1A
MKPRARAFLNFLGWCAALIATLALGAVIAGHVVYQRYAARAAAFDLTKIDEVAERSAIYDANGEFYSYFGGENRLVVPLASVSKHFVNALLAREDTRFWEHQGVDFQGVLRAVVANLRAGETKQGASTITQQLARNACELRARTFDRKALEAVLAQRIETTYTKDQILELYVNRIYFGSGFYGIETAARGYFGKPAAELTIGESATLAALIRSPKRLSPSHDLDASLAERDAVIERMREVGVITADEAAAAKAQQLKLAKRNEMRVADDEIMDATQRELETLLAPETLGFGGLKVFITIDPQLQRLAQAAADRRLSEIEEQKGFPHPKKRDFIPATESDGKEKQTDYLQAAVAVVDNRTGALRAAVGTRDYAQSKYSRALLSKRPVGSTFKPFVYAAAFERGMLPGTAVSDAKISPGEFRDLPKTWSPDNSDDEYGGLEPASFGLLKSRNTMSVRVGEFAGLPKVRELARAAGLSDDIPDLPVVFLGGFEATVKDLTAAYTVFPNLGIYRAPYLVSSVEDREGRVLWKAPQTEKRVLSSETAWMVSGVLQQVMKSGTAAKSGALGWKKNGGGKTGTTNKFFDAWFVGYTSSLTCGVWVGMDQPQTILEKGYGSALALPIWVDLMQQAPEKLYPAAPMEPPGLLTKATLCSVSGARATSVCVALHCAYEAEFPASRVPAEICHTHPEPASLPVTMAPASFTPPPATPPLVTSTNQPQRPPPPIAAAPAPAGNALPPPVGESPARSPARSPRFERASSAFVPPVEELPPPSTAPRVTEQPAKVVEVRRATPVEPSSRAVSRTPEQPQDGVRERRIVEQTPDGRIRITTIRSVGTPADTGADTSRSRQAAEPRRDSQRD